MAIFVYFGSTRKLKGFCQEVSQCVGWLPWRRLPPTEDLVYYLRRRCDSRPSPLSFVSSLHSADIITTAVALTSSLPSYTLVLDKQSPVQTVFSSPCLFNSSRSYAHTHPRFPSLVGTVNDTLHPLALAPTLTVTSACQTLTSLVPTSTLNQTAVKTFGIQQCCWTPKVQWLLFFGPNE